MYKLKMFDTIGDLLELTGEKTPEKLWDAGFDLDYWDAGFQADRPMHHKFAPEDRRDNYSEPSERVINDDARWLGHQMKDYCVGYSYTEYKGLHYYLVHYA